MFCTQLNIPIYVILIYFLLQVLYEGRKYVIVRVLGDGEEANNFEGNLSYTFLSLKKN